MAAELGLPPPAAPHQPPAPPTITDIGDDLLCEIFLLLPSLPSLVRAAIACSTFLHAVRSSPAFRRRFQALHPPQILGYFFERGAFPTFAPLRRRSDRDLAAVVRRSDFFLTHLPQDSGDSDSGWALASCHGGYVVLFNETTKEIAAYNPLTQALDIFPMPHGQTFRFAFLELYIVISEEDQGVFRMVVIQHRSMSGHVPALIAVFSSATREWTVLPWVEPYQPEDGGAPPMPPQPEEDGEDLISFYRGTRLNGLIYWTHMSQAYALVLDTVTLHFSRLNLPGFAGEIGQTKDWKLCIVGSLGTYSLEANVGTLAVWIWGADDDGVKEWKLAKAFQCSTFVDVTAGYATVQVEAVIDGFVYVSVKYVEQPESLVVSLCLETGKPCKLFDDTYTSPAHPYIMMWPRSLVCNKEDSQAKATGDSVADVCPVGTKESPYVLDVENSHA